MRKGQAAIEFLTTYGWAFIILLVAVGGLSYFGVFDVNRFAPESCSFGPPLGCPIFSVDYTPNVRTTFNLQIENIGAERITLMNFSAKDADRTTYCRMDSVLPVFPLDVAPGNSVDITVSFLDGSNGCVYADSFESTEEKRKLDVRAYYITRGATQQVSTSGTIITTQIEI